LTPSVVTNLRAKSSVRLCKIERIVVAAAGIEGGVASRTLVAARHVLLDAHLTSASAAQDGKFGPLPCWPELDGVVSQGIVAILASVIVAAAFHLDRDDIESRSIVCAARLRIEIDSENLWATDCHRSTD